MYICPGEDRRTDIKSTTSVAGRVTSGGRDAISSGNMEINCAKRGKKNSGSDADDETPANSPTKAVFDPADPHGYSSDVRNPYGNSDVDGGDDEASVISSAAGSVASSIQNIARDMISQLNSVLGGDDDDDDDDDAIRPEDEENTDASLAPV